MVDNVDIVDPIAQRAHVIGQLALIADETDDEDIRRGLKFTMQRLAESWSNPPKPKPVYREGNVIHLPDLKKQDDD